MAGLFDDVLGAQPSGSAGLFDDVLKPAPAPKDRTWGEAAADTSIGLAKGVVGLAKLVPMTVGAVDSFVSDAFNLGEPASGGAFNNIGTKALNRAEDYLQSKKSATIQAKEQTQEQDALAFGDKFKNDGTIARVAAEFGYKFANSFTDPALLLQGVSENVATMLPAGLAARGAQVAATKVAPRIAAELSKEAVEVAARRLGTAAGVTTGAVQQGADVASDAYDQMMKMDDAVWQRREDYVKLAQQIGADKAKNQIAGQLATEAGVRGGLASLVINGLGAKFGGATLESAFLKRGASEAAEGGLKGALKAGAKDALGETVTESLEEGYGAYAKNTAAQQVDETIDPYRGVGSAAGAGGVLGAVMGGGVGAVRGYAGERPAAPPAAPAVNPVDATLNQAVDRFEAARTAYLDPGVASDAVTSAPNIDEAINTATAIASGGTSSLAQAVGERAKGAQLAAAMDRQAELTAQANAAPTAFDRQNASEQAQVALESLRPAAQPASNVVEDSFASEMQAGQRLAVLRDEAAQAGQDPARLTVQPSPAAEGRFQIVAAPEPVAQVEAAPAPAPTPVPVVEQRLNAAANEGMMQAYLRQRDILDRGQALGSQLAQDLLPGDQQAFKQAYENVANRGGVASPKEAAVLDRMSPNERLYDSVEGKPPALKAAELPTTLPTAQQQAVDAAQSEGIARRMGLTDNAEVPGTVESPSLIVPERRAPARQRQPVPEMQAEIANTLRENANEASMTQLEQQAQQKQAEQNAAIEAATPPAQQTAPEANRVIAAYKKIPALRTAEDKAVVDSALRTYAPEDLRILRDTAEAPFRLSTTDRIRLGELRQSTAGVKTSEQRAAEAAEQPTAQADFTVADATPVNLKTLPQQSQANTGELSQQSHRFLKSLASIFGKKLVIFESTHPKAVDGYVISGANNTIYLNRNSQKSHLVVFGHELMHLLRMTEPGAYTAIRNAVKLRAEEQGRFDTTQGIRGDFEELISDLQGDLFSDTTFWVDVFREVAGKQNDKVVIRLGATLVRAVDRFIKALKSVATFDSSAMVANMGEVRSAIQTALATYANNQKGQAQALYQEEKNAANQESQQAGVQGERQTGDQVGAPAEAGVGNRVLGDEEIPAAEGQGRQGVAPPTKAEMAARRARQEMGMRFSEQRGGRIDNVEAYHFSKAPRKILNSNSYGSNYAGSGKEQYLRARDERRRQRIYFYFDKGTGVRPEAGVGGYAHKANLNNVYDINKDPLNLRAGTQDQTETNILDAGFSGYLDRMEGTQSGQVIMLGKQDIPVQPLPPGTRVQAGVQVEPAAAAAKPDWEDRMQGMNRDLLVRKMNDMRAKPDWDSYDMQIVDAGKGFFSLQTRLREDAPVKFSAARRGGTVEEVGDFKVRTQKDGTLGVVGDPVAIRALLPEGVRGRAVPGGMVFTTSDAPRVRAALEGRKLAYSRAGQVYDRLPMKDGKYIGAPEKYNTPAKIATLRKSLRNLSKEGEAGRFWYENSGRAVLDMAGGNVQEARKFVALLAIYSPQAKVDANSTFALRAWAQYKAGQPISVKTGVMDRKAQAALDNVDAFWSGEKTGNFFFNLLREIDPSTAGKQGATIDMWMMRAGEYNNDAPTATQYAFMENETNRLAQELGWEPQQVQAAIWVAMKARMENPGVKKRTEATSEKKGWIRYDYPIKNGRPTKTRVILNAQAHRDNWLKHSFQHDPTKSDTQGAKFDFSDGLRRHIGQISWEARPGRSTGILPGVNDASYEQQVEFQQAVQKALLDDNGVDLLAYKLGLLIDGPDILAPGVWQGEIAAGMQKLVTMAPAKGDEGKTDVDPAQVKALNTYASALGLLLRQEGVGYHRPFYKGKKSEENAATLSVGRTFAPAEAQALWGAIDERMRAAGVAGWESGAGLISSPSGMRVVNFGAISDNLAFQKLVADAAETLPFDEVELQSFSTDGDLMMNDWKENPNGEGYRSRISEAYGSDLLNWAGTVLAPRIQSVFNEFSSKYGWGNAGDVAALFPQEQQPAAEEVTANAAEPSEAPQVLFSQQRSINVDGVERSRLNSNGQRIAATEDGVRNFWRWFGDSGAAVGVNPDTGEPVTSSKEKSVTTPRVMYHTTLGDFNTFEVGRTTKNTGTFGEWETQRHAVFVTPDIEASSAYGKRGGKFAGGANSMPVYIKAETPLDLSDGLMWKDEKRFDQIGFSTRWLRNFDWSGFDDAEGKEFVEAAKRLGYDSVIFNDENPDTGDSFVAWAVFNPEQIKSATGNNGQFDPANPDIRYSRQRIVGDSSRPYTPEQKTLFQNVGRTIEVPTLKERIAELRKDLGKRITQGVVDQFAPIKDLTKDGYLLARLSKGAAGAIEAFMQHGKLSINGGVYDADRSGGVLDRVFKPLQGEAEDFLWWVAGNRAERLAKEDRENLFTPKDIAAAKSLDNGTTGFDYVLQHGPNAGKTTRDRTLIYRDTLKTFDEFNKNAMDMAEQSGLINKESRQYWEHEFYVPFYRVSEDTGGFVGGNIGKGLVRQQAFKQLKGGTDKLNSDLLANTLQNWSHLIDAAAKNRAAKATLEAAANQGIAVEAPQSTIQQMGKAGGKAVWFMDDGVQRHFLVDPQHSDLLDAINGLQFAGLRGPIMDALSGFKHWLTVGVTASPFFKIRNLIRDSMQAVAVSPLSYNPVTNFRQGLAASSRESQTYVSSLASGGLIRFGTMLEGNASERVRQLVRMGVDDSTILNSPDKIQAVLDKFRKGFMAYSEIGNRGEEINRAALYDQLVKSGVSHAEASLMARDLMDFSMQGSWASVRFLTQVVPFMNARLQGLYKLGKGAKEDKARFATVLGAVGAFSLMLLAMYHDDDDWKKREDWDRNNNWWFKVGGIAYRIPKPFEIGAMATLAERGVELFTSDEMTKQRFLKQVLTLAGDSLSMNPIPQAVKPVLDIYANKDSFSGRPIESMGMERLAPDYRFNSRTSMIARGLGTAGQSVLNATGLSKIGVQSLSPVQIDHLIQGYFSWLGAFAVGGADMLVRPMTNEPTRPAADMFKLASGGMVAQVDSASSRYVSDVYEQAKVLEQAYGTWRSLIKQGKVAEAREYFADNKDQIARYRMVEKVKAGEAKFNEMIRMIERSGLDPDAKRERINLIRAQQDRMARVLAPQ